MRILKTILVMLPMTFLLACGGGGGGHSGLSPNALLVEESSVNTPDETTENDAENDEGSVKVSSADVPDETTENDDKNLSVEEPVVTGSSDAPDEKTKKEPVANTPDPVEETNLPTPLTREELEAKARERVNEYIEEHRPNWVRGWIERYTEEIAKHYEDLQRHIDAGRAVEGDIDEEKDSIQAKAIKRYIEKKEELLSLYNNLNDELNKDLIDDDRVAELEDQIDRVRNPRKYRHETYTYQTFGAWLKGQPDAQAYLYNENGIRIGLSAGNQRTPETAARTGTPTYTGKYFGGIQRSGTVLKGDLTAKIEDWNDARIDFTFHDLRKQYPHQMLRLYRDRDTKRFLDDGATPNPNFLKGIPGVVGTGGELTETDVMIIGKIHDDNYISGEIRVGMYNSEIHSRFADVIDTDFDTALNRLKESMKRGNVPLDQQERILKNPRRYMEIGHYPKRIKLKAEFKGPNHDGIVGHLNAGQDETQYGNIYNDEFAGQGLLGIRFGAEKDSTD